MLKFILLRVIQAIPVVLAVITVTFFLVRAAPGGPFDSEKAVLPEVKKALEAQYKLDEPLTDQYFGYLGDLADGDLGPRDRRALVLENFLTRTQDPDLSTQDQELPKKIIHPRKTRGPRAPAAPSGPSGSAAT